MTPVKLVIDGAPRTAKNHQRIVTRKDTGKPFIIAGKVATSWAKGAVAQLREQWRGRAPLAQHVHVEAVFWRERATGDLSNYVQALHDALERSGVLVNDRLIVSERNRMDKDAARPRIELVISATEVS